MLEQLLYLGAGVVGAVGVQAGRGVLEDLHCPVQLVHPIQDSPLLSPVFLSRQEAFSGWLVLDQIHDALGWRTYWTLLPASLVMLQDLDCFLTPRPWTGGVAAF
jgi:hypothetical protein